MSLSEKSLAPAIRIWWGGEWLVRSTLRAGNANGAEMDGAVIVQNEPCSALLDIPGAFREFLTLPESNLHVVPDSVSTEAAVFVEPLAAACEILDQVKMTSGSEVAVLGDGKLGLLIAQALNANGMIVDLYGRHKNKLRIAERAGVRTILAGQGNSGQPLRVGC